MTRREQVRETLLSAGCMVMLFVLLFLFTGAFDTNAGVMGMQVVLLVAAGSMMGMGLVAWLAVVSGVMR